MRTRMEDVQPVPRAKHVLISSVKNYATNLECGKAYNDLMRGMMTMI